MTSGCVHKLACCLQAQGHDLAIICSMCVATPCVPFVNMATLHLQYVQDNTYKCQLHS